MGWSEDYWSKNRDRILKERKEKYAKDPEYRAKARDRARRYRENQKAEREAFLADPWMEIDGKKVSALTPDQMCQHIGIERSRLKYLQKAGYLPNPLVMRPHRLYTHRQADMIKDLNEFLRDNVGLLRVTDPTATGELDAKLTTMQQQWSKP